MEFYLIISAMLTSCLCSLDRQADTEMIILSKG